MPVIGITGGISTGKTTFCDCLREILPTATFFNADQAARDLAANDPEVKELIALEFGGEIYSAKGDLNRGRIRSIVFADAEKKRALEQILHPRIRRQWSTEAQRTSTDLFFADIPLLYETGGETSCDCVAVVACSADVQLERLVARMEGRAPASPPGDVGASRELRLPTKDQAQQMIDAQMPLAEKIRLADHVVWNNGGIDVLRAQAVMLARFWKQPVL
jgi:dephospho-CoA kinase